MNSDAASLDNLRDIVLPAPIAYWPPAPGWWILAVAALALLAIGAVCLVNNYRHNAYRRAALRELAALGSPLDAARAQALSAILKRAALVAYPRADVARLTGDAWLGFLDRTAGLTAFTKGAARQLGALALGASVTADDAGIKVAARRWIRHHRSDRGGG